MSQDVSVRETRMSSRRLGLAYHRRRALDVVRLCCHRQSSFVQRECGPLDRSERQYLGVDLATRRHDRPPTRLRRIFRRSTGATVGDVHRHPLGISGPKVHPSRAKVGHTIIFSGVRVHSADCPTFQSINSSRASVCVGRDLRTCRRLSNRPRTTGRILDEIERRF